MKKVARMVAYATAFVFALLAVLSTLFPLLIQELERREKDILSQMETLAGARIAVGDFLVESDAYDVVFVLDDIELLFPDMRPHRFKQATVRLNLWRTLLHKTPVADYIALTGAHWDIVTDGQGMLSVPTVDGGNIAFAGLAGTHTFRLVMKDTQVTWRTPARIDTFSDASLIFDFDDGEIKVAYDIPLPGGGQLHGIANMRGTFFDPGEWTGRVYTEISDMDMEAWGHLLPIAGIDKGRLSALLDMRREQGRFDAITGEVTLREYEWGDDTLAMHAMLAWQFNAGESFMSLRDLNLTSDRFDWQEANMRFWFDRSGEVLFSLVSPTVRVARLGQWNLTGTEGQADIQGRVMLPSDMQKPDTRYYEPDLRNLPVRLRVRLSGENMHLNHASGRYEWKDWKAEADFASDAKGYVLDLSEVSALAGTPVDTAIDSPGASHGQQSGNYFGAVTVVGEEGVRTGDISLSLTDTPIISLVSLMSLAVQDGVLDKVYVEELKPYTDGVLRRAEVTWVGLLPSNTPSDKSENPVTGNTNEEVYWRISGEIENADLGFGLSDRSSKVVDMNADFIFEDDLFTANIKSANIDGFDILAAQYVSVTARSLFTATMRGQLKDFIRNADRSAIYDIDLIANGTGKATITSNILPDGDFFISDGRLDIRRATIALADPPVVFSDVTGDIVLANNTITSGVLNGLLDNMPHNKQNGAQDDGAGIVSVIGRLKERNGALAITMDATINPLDFVTGYSLADVAPSSRLENLMQGKAKWRGEWLVLPDGKVKRMRFSSNLNGVKINLPEPLNKPADDAMPLVLDISDKEYTLTYGAGNEQVHARLTDRKDILSGNIHFGSVAPPPPDDRLLISGEPAGTIAVNEWMNRFTGNIAQTTMSRNVEVGLRPQAIRIGGWVIPTPDIKLHIDEVGWVVNLQSEPVGAILIKQGEEWVLNAERILLATTPGDISEMTPNGFPVIHAKVKNLQWGEVKVNNLTGVIKPINDGLSVSDTKFSVRDGAVSIDGTWRYVDGQHESLFSFEAESEDYGGLLKDLSLSESMEKGRGVAQGYFGWPAVPWEANLTIMSGNLQFDLKDGSLKRSKAGLERLVGLFNVTALVRRLNMDFQDVFDEGLTFDKMSGNFLLKDKNVRVQKLRIDNLNTDIKIQGDANIERREYDQEMTVVVKIHEGLPLAGGLLGGPLAALGIYVIDKATNISKIVDKFSTLKYKIEGSWDNPEIRFVSSDLVEQYDFENMVKPIKENIEKILPYER